MPFLLLIVELIISTSWENRLLADLPQMYRPLLFFLANSIGGMLRLSESDEVIDSSPSMSVEWVVSYASSSVLS